jgi:hypothetical protein
MNTNPVGVFATTARAAAAAVMTRTFRAALLACHNVATAAANKVGLTHGEEDPIYLANRDIAAAAETVLDELSTATEASDASFLEEIHEAATFAADATHTYVGSHRLHRMAQQAQEMAREGLQKVGDAAAGMAETAGLGQDSLQAAQENVRRRRRRRPNSCCSRCRRRWRSGCFRLRLWCNRTCGCC